jgi:hypothetical protein
MKMYENLKTSLFPFQEEMDIDDEQRYHLLKGNVSGEFLNIDDLKKELNEALNKEEFDWVEFANDNCLLVSPSSYDRREIENYVKMWLWDYLYPEKALTKNQIDQLTINVITTLRNYTENEGWMFSYDLYNVLKEDKKHQDLEYYNLWKLDFFDSVIERLPIEEKYQEIGYLRYKR